MNMPIDLPPGGAGWEWEYKYLFLNALNCLYFLVSGDATFDFPGWS